MTPRHPQRLAVRPVRRFCGVAVAAALAAALALGACGDSETASDTAPDILAPPESAASAPQSAADPLEAGRAQVDPGDELERRFYDAYLDEVLAGEGEDTRRTYRAILESGAEVPRLAAVAALRLAEYAAEERRRRVALDLAARAEALGGGSPQLLDGAGRLQERLSAVRAQDIEVRGPPAGTELVGVSPQVAADFAAAEEALAAYHRVVLSPRLEQLRASLRRKRVAMESAERAYKSVTTANEPVATAAAEFRMASLHYDLSLSLTFDLPSELDTAIAAELRSSLRYQAASARRQARSGYRRSLAAASLAGAGAQRWEEAARLGLASVEDLMRGRD